MPAVTPAIKVLRYEITSIEPTTVTRIGRNLNSTPSARSSYARERRRIFLTKEPVKLLPKKLDEWLKMYEKPVRSRSAITFECK